MPHISPNAVAPLELLLEATFFPLRAITKVQQLSGLQANEQLDALYHGALVWSQLVWEWAAEDGQIDVRTLIDLGGQSPTLQLAGFYDALREISQLVEIEYSAPLIPGVSINPRNVLPKWKGRQVNICERTRWNPLGLIRTVTANPGVKTHFKEIAPETKPLVFGQPFLEGDGRYNGEFWIRISPWSRKRLEKEMYTTLKSMSMLSEQRARNLREIVHRQNPKLTETQLTTLNNHLDSSWAETLKIIPKRVDALMKRRKVRGSRDATKHSLALKGYRVLSKILNKPRDEQTSWSKNLVFISYSRADEKWLNEILKMLAPMIREKPVTVWYDRKIKAGQKWREEITKAMESAKVGVLLLSPNFLASEFITAEELPFMLKAAERKELKLLIIFLNHCAYEFEPKLAEIQAVNDPSKPLRAFTTVPNRNKETLRICRVINETVQAIGALKGK